MLYSLLIAVTMLSANFITMDVHLHNFPRSSHQMRGLERGQVFLSPRRNLKVSLPGHECWAPGAAAARTAEELCTADTHPHLRIKSIVFEKKEINFIFSTLKKNRTSY